MEMRKDSQTSQHTFQPRTAWEQFQVYVYVYGYTYKYTSYVDGDVVGLLLDASVATLAQRSSVSNENHCPKQRQALGVNPLHFAVWHELMIEQEAERKAHEARRKAQRKLGNNQAPKQIGFTPELRTI